MRPFLFVGLALIAAVGCRRSGDPASAAEADIVLRDVTVLSPVDGSRRYKQTVRVAGERILSVAAGEDPGHVADGGRVVDASGLFLIPGLWDFHTHLWHADPNAAPLMVTQGVTGARDMGGVLDEIDALRERIRRGEFPGPRIVRVGPTLNGAANAPHHRVISTPEAAREAVADLASRDVDLLKTHNATGRETYFALVEAASDAGFDVVGHVPKDVSPLEACEAGQASIDHVATFFEGVYLRGFASELDAVRGMSAWLETGAPALVECFARHGTLFVPTLSFYRFRAQRAMLYDDPPEGWRYLTAANRVAFREEMTPSARERDPEVIALRESLVEVGMIFTRLLYEAGVPTGAGTDFWQAGPVPGFSLRHEIELLVEAGLPEHAAIWASARGPGERAGADPLTGRIEAGAPADLVLLRADPFDRIDALSSIEVVVASGRLLDRTELDEILRELPSR